MVHMKDAESNPYLVQNAVVKPKRGHKRHILDKFGNTDQTELQLRRRQEHAKKQGMILRVYLSMGNVAFEQLRSEGFTVMEMISVANVCTMLVFVAWDVQCFTTEGCTANPPMLLFIGRCANTGLFYWEFCMRLASEGTNPLMLFRRSDRMWRILDFLNLILNSTSGTMSVYRVLVGYKMVEYIIQDSPKIRVLFYSIIHGIKQLLGICCFIFFVAYLYAILGVFLFERTDPFHFGTLGASFSTVSVVATFEDWSEVFYTNYYGCAVYAHSVYLHQPIGIHCDETLAIPNKTYTLIFFVSYVCISVFLLSLFVSTLTLQLAQAYKDVKLEMKRGRAYKLAEETLLLDTLFTMSAAESMAQNLHVYKRSSWWEYDRTKMSVENINLRIETALLLRGAFEQELDHDAQVECFNSMKVKAELNTGFARVFYHVYKFAQKVNRSKNVSKALACLILVNAVMLGVFTAYLKDIRNAWATFVGGIFFLELFFKLAAEGLHPWRHFIAYCAGMFLDLCASTEYSTQPSLF
jgi:hypothetical protein